MSRPFRVIIASVQVPFTSGGAEVLVCRLKQELESKGAQADIVQIPFTALPRDGIVKGMSYWRALDLTSFNGMPVDLVIATKFPSYLVRHPRKVVWLIHQYRQAYDLYGSRFGDLHQEPEDEALRTMILEADRKGLNEAKGLYTISDNVTGRLKKYLDIEAKTLVPPLPLAGRYRKAAPQPYILSVGRICSIKRVDMVIKAMAEVDERLTLKVVGQADESEIESYIKSEIDKHHLWHRIDFLGRVSDEELLKLYSEAFLVYYAPYDEDLGFVTLEGLSSGVPVVTAKDSGGSLAYITDNYNGIVVEPNEQALASGINRIVNETGLYESLRSNASGENFLTSWDTVINALSGGEL